MKESIFRIPFLIFLAALVTVNCSLFQNDTEEEAEGLLEVRIEDGIDNRGIQPNLDMTIIDYHITISGPGETQSQTISEGESTASFSSLEPGEWTVTVNARNGDDPPVVIATGETAAAVLNEQTTTVDITVLPVEGQGTLNLTIDWPAGLLTAADVTASLTPDSGTEQDISDQFTIDTGVDPNTASYMGSWDAGYYTLNLFLTDEGSQVWGDMIAVRIIAGETSIGQYSLQESELNLVEILGGTFEVNVGSNLQNPYTITLNGQQGEIGPAEDMTINAVLDPAGSPDSYEWYLDGDVQEGFTGNSITLGPSGVPVEAGKTHQLTLAVHDGSSISTEKTSFRVAWLVEMGSIAFISNRNDTYYGLCTMYTDGSSFERLTSDQSVSNEPDWAPNGSQIVFSYYDDIYRIGRYGSGLEPITQNTFNDENPAWSPNGEIIAFDSDRNGDKEIFTINVDGSGEEPLTDNEYTDSHPDWSPDGSQIVFSSDRLDGNMNIFIMNSNGDNVQQLTSDPALEDSPAWSPDGSKIAFYRGGDIYSINPDSTGVTQITTLGHADIQPAWSPDSSKILFSSARGDGFGSDIYEICIIDADGTDFQRLTTNSDTDFSPAWGAN